MCDHKNFLAAVDVCRLTADTDSNNVVGFAVDVKINCAECGMPFEFIGLPVGISAMNSKPMISMDGKELRAPIKPSIDPADEVNSLLNSQP
jgi:hypothetical protein